MYDRKAKGINSEVWSDIMLPTSPVELLSAIRESGKEKAAGYDGVSIDLISILADEGPPENNHCLQILTWLINKAFAEGETLKSGGKR